jgi:hypothetical protein
MMTLPAEDEPLIVEIYRLESATGMPPQMNAPFTYNRVLTPRMLKLCNVNTGEHVV